jgi:hypothetical protein
VKRGGGGGSGGRRKAVSQIIHKYHDLRKYMKHLYHGVSSHEETLGDFKYTLEEDKITHKYRLIATYKRLFGKDDTFVLYSMKPRELDADATPTPSKSRLRSPSNGRKSKEDDEGDEKHEEAYSVSTSRLSYNSNREKEIAEGDIYNIVRDVFIKNRAVFFGGYANILYSRYMPKHQRRIIQKIPDFDILSEDPRELCETVVRELTSHNYKDVKYTKHAGVGEVISEHYDIRVGDEVIAFLYKPLACHSYNTIRIDSDATIRIATIDTMLSFYLAFIYANRVYYDINRILCMSQFLFDVQQHNRLKQTGLLRRFSINCYGKQPTLESMRFEKTEKYEELKGKRDSKEFEEWFLRYIPYEHASAKKSTKGTRRRARRSD